MRHRFLSPREPVTPLPVHQVLRHLTAIASHHTSPSSVVATLVNRVFFNGSHGARRFRDVPGATPKKPASINRIQTAIRMELHPADIIANRLGFQPGMENQHGKIRFATRTGKAAARIFFACRIRNRQNNICSASQPSSSNHRSDSQGKAFAEQRRYRRTGTVRPDQPLLRKWLMNFPLAQGQLTSAAPLQRRPNRMQTAHSQHRLPAPSALSAPYAIIRIFTTT